MIMSIYEYVIILIMNHNRNLNVIVPYEISHVIYHTDKNVLA